jgi:hypothetical protein
MFNPQDRHARPRWTNGSGFATETLIFNAIVLAVNGCRRLRPARVASGIGSRALTSVR